MRAARSAHSVLPVHITCPITLTAPCAPTKRLARGFDPLSQCSPCPPHLPQYLAISRERQQLRSAATRDHLDLLTRLRLDSSEYPGKVRFVQLEDSFLFPTNHG